MCKNERRGDSNNSTSNQAHAKSQIASTRYHRTLPSREGRHTKILVFKRVIASGSTHRVRWYSRQPGRGYTMIFRLFLEQRIMVFAPPGAVCQVFGDSRYFLSYLECTDCKDLQGQKNALSRCWLNRERHYSNPITRSCRAGELSTA